MTAHSAVVLVAENCALASVALAFFVLRYFSKNWGNLSCPDKATCRHCRERIIWSDYSYVHRNGWADCGVVMGGGWITNRLPFMGRIIVAPDRGTFRVNPQIVSTRDTSAAPSLLRLRWW